MQTDYYYARKYERNPGPAARLYPGTKGDVPEPYEHILLLQGQSKILWQDISGVPNTSIFTFGKEDHTLGNLISQRLLKYDFILFSAYKVGTPMEASFDLRVETDGSITPKDAVIQCCKDVIEDLERVKQSFSEEFMMHKAANEYRDSKEDSSAEANDV